MISAKYLIEIQLQNRKVCDKIPLLKTYDLFISHAWDYNNQYYNLTNLLKNYSYFNFKNYSVPEHDPIIFDTTQLYKQLEEQIRQSSVVLLIAGKYIKYRKWIREEIKIAKKYGKPIIAIRPWALVCYLAKLNKKLIL